MECEIHQVHIFNLFLKPKIEVFSPFSYATVWRQRYTYKVLQTIQMKPILLCIWAEWAVLGSAKSALKFKYEI